jgi:dipeptidyl aminopeptidase/acylaminoacyl peptidase
MTTHSTRRLVTIAAVVLVAGAALPRAGQSRPAARPVELADFYRLESAGSPAISPDGRFVAFVRTAIVEDENRRHTEIWLARTDGSAPAVRVTNPAFSASSPSWSPDGALLAFSSRRRVPAAGSAAAPAPDEETSIWFLRMDRPGGEAFQINGVGGTPIFSPDNRWIAFTKATRSGPLPKPQFASEFDKKIHDRFKGKVFDWMQYRFDGRGYLPDPRNPDATPPQELCIVARDGGAPRRLTSLGVNVSDVAWRPDSQALAFTANSHQRDESIYERSDLWTVPLEGDAKRLTDDGYDHSSPAWSPDGRTLVFRREQGLSALIASKQAHGAESDVYRMPADGGSMVNMTAQWDLLPGAPRYSADGRSVFFTSGIGGTAQLFRIAAAGGSVEQVTKGDRQIGGISYSAAFDRIAYTLADSSHPAEVYTSRIDGSDERKLSSVNDALLASLDLGRVERIKYPSKDGTQIEGWIVLPPGYGAASAPYPMVLSIHGGPHGAYGVDFSFPFQLLAAHGYIVLYTNPRGSTNYGEKFLWATWGGWGNLDYDDVMAGVDYTLAHYRVDPRRLGVTGYSYGGFLTNWIITRTPRFAAAIVGAGISNWLSDYGTADIPRTKESEFFGAPWDAKGAETLLKQSPIMYAANVKTPTMFVHGEFDARVPIEQGEQMYTALKKRGVPAMFIRYPETYHGGWTPWNTVHRYYNELKWWDKYLGARTKGTQ